MKPPTIGDIPPEILSKIFLFYRDSLSKPHEAPIPLGLVCRRWRSVTLDMHALWSSITVDRQDYHVNRQTPMIKKWLARSHNLPCDIELVLVQEFVEEPEEEEEEEEEEYETVTGILPAVASRIRSLTLTITLGELDECLRVIKRGLPRLEALQFDIIGSPYEPLEIDNMPLNLSRCPRLKSVILSKEIIKALRDDFVQTMPSTLEVFRVIDGNYVYLEPSAIKDMLLTRRSLRILSLELQLLGGVLHFPLTLTTNSPTPLSVSSASPFNRNSTAFDHCSGLYSSPH